MRSKGAGREAGSGEAGQGGQAAITHAMLDIYCAFAGDIDGYARQGSAQQRRVINDEQWRAIAGLVQDVFLLVAGKVSADNAARIAARLSAASADASVAARLRVMAGDAAPDPDRSSRPQGVQRRP